LNSTPEKKKNDPEIQAMTDFYGFLFLLSLFFSVMEHPGLTPRRLYHDCLFHNALNVIGFVCVEGIRHFITCEFAI
jgi:hypothetical protein